MLTVDGNGRFLDELALFADDESFPNSIHSFPVL
jgi:hypothetical protein